MADKVFNIALGKVGYYAMLPATNDALIAVLLFSSGIEADATLLDHDTLASILAGTSDEAAGGTYVRKTLASVTSTPDDTNHRLDADAADVTWTALTTSGNAAVAKMVICYDPDTTGGTDADLIPLTLHDCAETPSGSDLVVTISNFFRASAV